MKKIKKVNLTFKNKKILLTEYRAAGSSALTKALGKDLGQGIKDSLKFAFDFSKFSLMLTGSSIRYTFDKEFTLEDLKRSVSKQTLDFVLKSERSINSIESATRSMLSSAGVPDSVFEAMKLGVPAITLVEALEDINLDDISKSEDFELNTSKRPSEEVLNAMFVLLTGESSDQYINTPGFLTLKKNLRSYLDKNFKNFDNKLYNMSDSDIDQLSRLNKRSKNKKILDPDFFIKTLKSAIEKTPEESTQRQFEESFSLKINNNNLMLEKRRDPAFAKGSKFESIIEGFAYSILASKNLEYNFISLMILAICGDLNNIMKEGNDNLLNLYNIVSTNLSIVSLAYSSFSFFNKEYTEDILKDFNLKLNFQKYLEEQLSKLDFIDENTKVEINRVIKEITGKINQADFENLDNKEKAINLLGILVGINDKFVASTSKNIKTYKDFNELIKQKIKLNMISDKTLRGNLEKVIKATSQIKEENIIKAYDGSKSKLQKTISKLSSEENKEEEDLQTVNTGNNNQQEDNEED